MSKIDAALTDFEKKVNVVLDRVNGLTQDQIDWKLEIPLGDDYWSVRQILAHIEEVNIFWIPRIKNLLVDPSSFIGRSPEDLEVRAKAVDTAYDRELPEILNGIKESVKNVRRELGGMTDEQYEDIAAIFEHVYPDHIDEHLKHIERTLFAYSQYH